MAASISEPRAQALRESRDDPDSFGRFYCEHSDALLAHFLRRTYEFEVALDLTAETMAQAFLGRRGFRGSTDAEAGAWLYGIAERQLAQYFRRRAVEGRAMKRLGLERPRPSDDVDARVIERETFANLQGAISSERGRLSAEQRSAIELRFDRELSYAEIADRLAISEPAARARVSRALRKLGESLNQKHPTPLEGVS